MALTLNLGNRESYAVPDLSIFLEILSVLRSPWPLPKVKVLMRGLFPFAPARHVNQMVMVAHNRMVAEALRSRRQGCQLDNIPVSKLPSSSTLQRSVEKIKDFPLVDEFDCEG